MTSTKAEQLKRQLYDPDAKLTDLFGNLEPKLMLDQIMNCFWDSCLPQVLNCLPLIPLSVQLSSYHHHC